MPSSEVAREDMIRIIDENGESIIIYAPSSDTLSSRYKDRAVTYDSGTTVTAMRVKEGNVVEKEQESELRRPTGMVRLFLKYDTTIANDYRVNYNSVNYVVVALLDRRIGGDIVYRIVDIEKEVPS